MFFFLRDISHSFSFLDTHVSISIVSNARVTHSKTNICLSLSLLLIIKRRHPVLISTHNTYTHQEFYSYHSRINYKIINVITFISKSNTLTQYYLYCNI